MQAYQSAPCPTCGITWNPPGAQACANCRNPLASPPAYAPPGYAPPGSATVGAFGRSIVVPASLAALLARAQSSGRRLALGAGAVVALLLLVFAVLPAVASAQIAGAGQAIAGATSHQRSVDAAMALFLHPPPAPLNDPAAEKAATSRQLAQLQAALSGVQAAQSAVRALDQHLAWP